MIAFAMPFNIAAFVANCCLAVGRLTEGINVEPPLGQFHHGTQFLRAFIDPNIGGSFSSSRCLALRSDAPSHFDGTAKPVELVLQFHVRHLDRGGPVLRTDLEYIPDSQPGIACTRQVARFQGSWRVTKGVSGITMSLCERMSSLSLSIWNTKAAPYTILLLADNGEKLVSVDPNLEQRAREGISDAVFPGTHSSKLLGLRPSGRCTGLSQFLVMVLTIFRQWEKDWLGVLRAIEDLVNFHVSYTPRIFHPISRCALNSALYGQLSSTQDDSVLDALMFDESFNLSRTYFSVLQTLRLASNMVDDAMQDWAYLRQEWDAVVVSSEMFSQKNLDAAAHNWDTATALLEAKVQSVQARIARKSEDVKSLRDGV